MIYDENWLKEMAEKEAGGIISVGGLVSRVVQETTEEWLQVFADSKAKGEDLASSVFWRLALHTLPEAVNPEDPRVKEALEEICKAVGEAK